MIPVFRPCMGNDEVRAVAQVLKGGWIGLGPKTKEFETQFAAYIGTKYAIGVNSATAALHLALMALNVKGGEVITTPMTFVSTNHAILYNNAIPVFCDIEQDTLNIDPNKIEALITKKTKAILVVHYGGFAVNMAKVLSLAKKYNLNVIEDVAHGCGGEFKAKKLGSLADIGCFSFHAVKNLATGDGGMITTNNTKAYERLMKLRWVGISKDTWSRQDKKAKNYSWYYNVEELGYKYHMNDITASIGLVQLKKLDLMNQKRENLATKYSNAFAHLPQIETPVQKDYMTKPSYHNYVIKLRKRDELSKHLASLGISTGVHYIPNNRYNLYKNYRSKTPIAQNVWKTILTLPLFPDLKFKDQDFVINSIQKFYQ